MTDFENENMDLEDLENDIIELIDEDGEPVPFEYLTTVEYEGKKYIVLIPVDEEEEDEEESEVVILEIQEDENGEDVYVSLDDDELLDKVFEEFRRIVDEQEDAEE